MSGAVHDVVWMEYRLRYVQFGRSRQQGNDGGVVAKQSRITSSSAVWVLAAEGLMVYFVINFVVLDIGKRGWDGGFFRGRAFSPSTQRCIPPRIGGVGGDGGTQT